jgi:glycerol-3-phosphate dehydrogenase subunit B
VAVDREMRPVDAAGERIYENVLVAGASLAGATPWREKSGDGVSLSTGFRAADLILAASAAAESEAQAVGR